MMVARDFPKNFLPKGGSGVFFPEHQKSTKSPGRMDSCFFEDSKGGRAK